MDLDLCVASATPSGGRDPPTPAFSDCAFCVCLKLTIHSATNDLKTLAGSLKIGAT